MVLENPVTNRSALDGRRTDIEVRAAARRADEIRTLVLGAAAIDRVREQPRPRIFLREWQPERLIFLLRVWHDPDDDDAAVSAVIIAIGEALDAAGIAATVVAPPPPAGRTPPANL